MYRLLCEPLSADGAVLEYYFHSMEAAKRRAEDLDASTGDGGLFDWEVSPRGYLYEYGSNSNYMYYIEPIVFEEDKPNA